MSTDTIQSNDSAAKQSSNTMLLLVLSVVVLLAYLPSLVMHFQVLWNLEQYQYFPFIIGAVGWLGWSRWKEASLVEGSDAWPWYRRALHNQLPIVWALLAFATLAVAVYFQWGWFAAVSLNLLTGAGLLVLSKHFHIRNAWGIWALMWLMVPPPIEFGANVVQRMQLASSLMSSQILDLLRIDHLMTGNVFTLPTKQLFVDEACSGIVSVMSVIAATGIYAVWRDRSLFHACLLMLISVGWALVMNTVRIVSVAVAEAKFGIDLAEGTPHEILGLVLFSLTFIASMSTDQLLEFLLTPIKLTAADPSVNQNPLVRLWNWWASRFIPKSIEADAERGKLNQLLTTVLTPRLLATGIPIAVVGIWSGLVAFGMIGGKPTSLVDAIALHSRIQAETLPPQTGSWTRTGYEASDRRGDNVLGNYDFGQFSNSFVFDGPNYSAHVSMDYPFSGGWHELSACYRASGWSIVERNARSENSQEFVETSLKFPNEERYGYLLFNNFDERGKVVTPPSGAILVRSWLFIRRRFLRKIAGDLYQAQVFVVSDTPLTDEEKVEVRQLFLTAEERLTGTIGELAQQQVASVGD